MCKCVLCNESTERQFLVSYVNVSTIENVTTTSKINVCQWCEEDIASDVVIYKGKKYTKV